MLRVEFLGTGTSQGVPLIGCDCRTCFSADARDKRLRPSIWLTTAAGEHIIIDVGPDFRAQALRARIPRVDAVLLTHEHRDHIGGLDDLRAYNIRQGEIKIYGQGRTLSAVERAYEYIFKSNYPGIPLLGLVEIEAGRAFSPIATSPIENTNNESPNTTFLPLPIFHGELPILGFRLGKFAYLTDCKTIPDETLAQLAGVDTVVLSALHHEPHHSHSTVAEALAWAAQIGARRTFFTHMSHHLPLIAEAEQLLPAGVSFAYDGLVLQIEG
jgi:phosphoribosyl 1,2-cyclic phosphate phosphodiesterase